MTFKSLLGTPPIANDPSTVLVAVKNAWKNNIAMHGFPGGKTKDSTPRVIKIDSNASKIAIYVISTSSELERKMCFVNNMTPA